MRQALAILIIAAAMLTAPLYAGEMKQVSRTIVVDASADAVWGLLRQIDGVEAYSGGMVTHSKLIGKPGKDCTRVCKMQDGQEVREKIVEFDDTTRTYAYQIKNGPFPMSIMTNRARVVDLGYNRSMVIWSSNFLPKAGGDPAQMTAMMGGMLEMVLGNVKQLIEKPVS